MKSESDFESPVSQTQGGVFGRPHFIPFSSHFPPSIDNMRSCSIFSFSFQCFYIKKTQVPQQGTSVIHCTSPKKPDVFQPFKDCDKHGFSLLSPQ